MDVGSEIVAVRSDKVVLDDTIGPAEIVICNGKIVNILPKRNWVRPTGENVSMNKYLCLVRSIPLGKGSRLTGGTSILNIKGRRFNP